MKVFPAELNILGVAVNTQEIERFAPAVDYDAVVTITALKTNGN